MPQFRPKAMLERTAAADLFKHTLSTIPTTFGQIAYLASLRDPHSGNYQHHGLAAIFGRDESRKALGETHAMLFQGWLKLPLSQRRSDLSEYLSQLEDSAAAVLRNWAETEIYRSYLPPSARKGERELFLRDFEVLLHTFPRRDKSKLG